jgi:hypothetical protein
LALFGSAACRGKLPLSAQKNNYAFELAERIILLWNDEPDMPMPSPHVSCWGINGLGWDVARSLKMTPQRTAEAFTRPVEDGRYLWSDELV